MSSTNLTEVTFVVIESHGTWPACIQHGQDQDVHVVAQQEAEAAGIFADRILAKLDALRQRRFSVGWAVMACNERSDRTVDRARHSIANAVLTSMSQSESPRLVLTARDRGAGSARHAVCALAQDLSAEWAGTGITVSVRFDSFVRRPEERVQVA